MHAISCSSWLAVLGLVVFNPAAAQTPNLWLDRRPDSPYHEVGRINRAQRDMQDYYPQFRVPRRNQDPPGHSHAHARETERVTRQTYDEAVRLNLQFMYDPPPRRPSGIPDHPSVEYNYVAFRRLIAARVANRKISRAAESDHRASLLDLNDFSRRSMNPIARFRARFEQQRLQGPDVVDQAAVAHHRAELQEEYQQLTRAAAWHFFQLLPPEGSADRPRALALLQMQTVAMEKLLRQMPAPSRHIERTLTL